MRKQQQTAPRPVKRFHWRRKLAPEPTKFGGIDLASHRDEIRRVFQLRGNVAADMAPELAQLICAAYMLLVPFTTPAANTSWEALNDRLPTMGGPTGFVAALLDLSPEKVPVKVAHKVTKHLLQLQAFPARFEDHISRFALPVSRWLWRLCLAALTGMWLQPRDKNYIEQHALKELDQARQIVKSQAQPEGAATRDRFREVFEYVNANTS